VVRIGCQQGMGKVLLSISDQGVGISKENQRRLFERFYRVNDELSNQVSGFGIGLYLVAEILKLHGSQIKVESEPDKGAVFSFALDTYGASC